MPWGEVNGEGQESVLLKRLSVDPVCSLKFSKLYVGDFTPLLECKHALMWAATCSFSSAQPSRSSRKLARESVCSDEDSVWNAALSSPLEVNELGCILGHCYGKVGIAGW